jgi:hypothetical protein
MVTLTGAEPIVKPTRSGSVFLFGVEVVKMKFMRKAMRAWLFRISTLLLVLAICGGSVLVSYPALADDGGGEASPASDASVPATDVSAPSDVEVVVVDVGTPVCDVEATAADAGTSEADISAPDAIAADAETDTGDTVAETDVAAVEADSNAAVNDLETPVEDISNTADEIPAENEPTAETIESDTTAFVSTGQADYLPGDTVDISGEGFVPNADVIVTLTKPDGTATEWTVTADDAGQIATNYELTDFIEGAYFVALSDGNNTGSTLFTDPVTVLSPNGNGSATQLSDYPSAGANYLKVDDAAPDGDSTYVYTNNTSTSGRRDLYAIGNLTDTVKPNNPAPSSTSHATGVWSNNPTVVMVWNGVSDPGSASANSVTVKATCRTTAASPGGSAAVGIRPSGGTESWSTAETLDTSYGQVSSAYNTNPSTGQPWTYTDINNLQAGVRLRSPSTSTQARSTMVWLEVSSDDTMASGVYRYYYEWNDSTPDLYMANQGTGVEHTVTQTMASGKHTFYVYARDNANNNSSTISSGQYWIDVTNPTLSTSRTPAANSYGWNRTDVTARYTARDTHSGLATPSSGSVVVSTEGEGQSVSFTAVDNVGNTTSKTVTGINIDKTKPIVAGSTSPGATPYGWNNTDVTVHFTGTDALSGIATVTPDVIISSEGINRSANGTATDKAGNSASTTVSGINIDKTNPTISGSRTPNANAHGWNNTDVTVSFTGNDALSGIDTVTPATTVSSEGVNQFVTGTAIDKAGNSASTTVNGINIDKTSPTVSGSVSPGATPYGWHNTDVIVHFSAEDNLSGVDTVTPDVTLSAEGANQSAGGSATDLAGNSASTTVSGISIDKTAPTISGSVSPGANAHGWNNSDVTVSFTADDSLSGIATVTPDTVLSSEGADQSVTGIAADRASNSASTTVSGINIDKTDPTLTDDLSRTGMDEVTVTLMGDDALSGVDFIRYSPDGGVTWTTVYSPTTTFTISGIGEYNLSNLVFDIAGNEYVMDRSFNIEGFAAGQPTSGPTLEVNMMGTVASYPVTADGMLLPEVKVASPDNALVLQIPAGGRILDANGKPASQVQIVASDVAEVPEGYQLISAYQVLPIGVQFPEEGTLTMSYAGKEIPENNGVVMAFYDGAAGQWAGLEKLGTVAELGMPETVTSQVGDAGFFAVFARVPQP